MRNSITIALISAFFTFVSCCGCQEDPMSLKMVKSEMARCPDATYLDFLNGKVNWNYTSGLEMKAFLDVAETYGCDSIFNYVDAWYDNITNEVTGINEGKYNAYGHNVDHICPARTLFYLYDRTGKAKYKAALDLVRSQIDHQPRTADGCFWHKDKYPHQVWLDGLYMAQPFYAEYTARFEPDSTKEECFKEIVSDFINTAKHTYDPATKLYRHAWDESREMFWCDPETGQSQHCWGRALGWYCMGIVDVLDWIPVNIEGRAEVITILRDICDVLPSFADPQSGMWYQVLDCPGREGNYLEATCSAMFVYTYLKGVRMGYLDSKYSEYAKDLYSRLVKQFISYDDAGLMSINDCCSVGGLGGKEMRMGDFAYYLSEPIRSNDAKGVGPFIWASLEMERK